MSQLQQVASSAPSRTSPLRFAAGNPPPLAPVLPSSSLSPPLYLHLLDLPIIPRVQLNRTVWIGLGNPATEYEQRRLF